MARRHRTTIDGVHHCLVCARRCGVGPGARERGGQVRTRCGTRVWRETVIVYLRDRALGRDESLAQSFYFVSRFPSGFRAW
ncbi:MAG: hypothetical protein QOE10_2464 [Gaiellales bacterium]|nr:hypothetical protein [Gaiellales bacterium]